MAKTKVFAKAGVTFALAFALTAGGFSVAAPQNAEAKEKGPKVSVNCKSKRKGKYKSVRYQETSYTIMVKPKSGRKAFIRYKVFDNFKGKNPGKKFRKLYDYDSWLGEGDVGFCLHTRKGTGNTKQKNKYRHYETASVYYYKQSILTGKWVCASKPTKITLKYNSKGKLKYSVKR